MLSGQKSVQNMTVNHVILFVQYFEHLTLARNCGCLFRICMHVKDCDIGGKHHTQNWFDQLIQSWHKQTCVTFVRIKAKVKKGHF